MGDRVQREGRLDAKRGSDAPHVSHMLTTGLSLETLAVTKLSAP